VSIINISFRGKQNEIADISIYNTCISMTHCLDIW